MKNPTPFPIPAPTITYIENTLLVKHQYWFVFVHIKEVVRYLIGQNGESVVQYVQIDRWRKNILDFVEILYN